MVDLAAAEALVAASPKAEVIVVERRPRRAGTRSRVDGITSEVTCRAQCPVLVVHADDQIVMRRGVLAVLDGRDPDVSALVPAFEEARVRNVPLSVVECTAGPRGVVPRSAGSGLVRERAEATVAGALARCRREIPGVRLAGSVTRVDSFAVLMGLARDGELAVVSRARRGEQLGPLASHLVAEAACPVLVLQPGRPAQSLVSDVAPGDAGPCYPVRGLPSQLPPLEVSTPVFTP